MSLSSPTVPLKPMPRKTLLYSILLFIFFIVLYSPIFPDMYHLWMGENGNNSHGILVPFISLFLIWRKREKINWGEAKSSNVGLVILIVSLLVYLVGYAGGMEVLPRLTIVSTLIGLVIFNLGFNIFSRLAFPLLFLFFMVPVPVSIVGLVSLPLQLIATKLSAFIINSLSIPVLREGNILHFANTSLEVAEACSGIRSLISYLMLGVLFAYLMNGSMKRRFILVFSTVPLAFFANLLRVITTGVLAHFFGSKVARGFLHEFSGMAIFVFGFILLFVLYNLLERTRKANIE